MGGPRRPGSPGRPRSRTRPRRTRLDHVLGATARFRRYTPRMPDIEAWPVAQTLLEAIDVLRSDGTARPPDFPRPNSKWSRRLRTQADPRLWQTAVRSTCATLSAPATSGWRGRAATTITGGRCCRFPPARRPTAASRSGPSARLARRAPARPRRRSAPAGRQGTGRCGRGRQHRRPHPPRRQDEGHRAGRAADLVTHLYRRMPEARITDILLEVDDATRFTEAFTHLRTGSSCRDRIGPLNVLLAERTNLGVRKMAKATTTHGFWELMRIARWHCGRGRVRPSPGHRRRGPGRATDGRRAAPSSARKASP